MSGNKIMLDTNALGPYLDGKFAKEYVKPKEIISISIISKLEFLSNPQLTPKNKFFFEEFCELAEIYSVSNKNVDLTNQVITIRKKYKLKLPDVIIAATAIVNDATLFSAVDVFSKIFNLKFQLIKV